jgi:hypothetical protein
MKKFAGGSERFERLERFERRRQAPVAMLAADRRGYKRLSRKGSAKVRQRTDQPQIVWLRRINPKSLG